MSRDDIARARAQQRRQDADRARAARYAIAELRHTVRREARETARAVSSAHAAALQDLRTLAHAARPRAPPLPSKTDLRGPRSTRPTVREQVRRAAIELGPNASLHAIAYRSKASHKQAQQHLRALGATMTSNARSDNWQPGRSSTWTLQATADPEA